VVFGRPLPCRAASPGIIAVVEALASLPGLLEAPRPGPDGRIYFTDLTGGVFSLSGGEVTTLLPNRRGIGGLALHPDGRLAATGRSVIWLWPDGSTTELLAPGPGAVGFNDMHVTPDGTLLVGALRHRLGETPVAGEVLALRAGAEPEPLGIKEIWWPNGMGSSPDGQWLYVADFHTGSVLRGPVDGDIVPWIQTGSWGEADGLTVDAEGGVLVALGVRGAVARYFPDGTLDWTLDVPANFVSSVALAGNDLLITAGSVPPESGGTLFRVQVEVPGLPVTLREFGGPRP
jgi:D-xylonolactonase